MKLLQFLREKVPYVIKDEVDRFREKISYFTDFLHSCQVRQIRIHNTAQLGMPLTALFALHRILTRRHLTRMRKYYGNRVSRGNPSLPRNRNCPRRRNRPSKFQCCQLISTFSDQNGQKFRPLSKKIRPLCKNSRYL